MMIRVERRDPGCFTLRHSDSEQIVGFARRLDGDRWGLFGPDGMRLWTAMSFAIPTAVAKAVEKRKIKASR